MNHFILSSILSLQILPIRRRYNRCLINPTDTNYRVLNYGRLTKMRVAVLVGCSDQEAEKGCICRRT